MRKLITLLFFVGVVSFTASAQETPTADAKLLAANKEIKTELISQLKFSDAQAENIVAIETQFYTGKAEVDASKITMKEKKEKMHPLHTKRHAMLLEANIKGRQIEDAIMLVETVRKKHKL